MHFPENTFFMLMAPPAWGKTRMICEWTDEYQKEFLYISPLRALAIEVKEKIPNCWVVLPEEILKLDWNGLSVQKPGLIVIWDEIHLVYEWGETFRHALLEAWYGFCVSGLRGVGLTATLTIEQSNFFYETLKEAHTHVVTGDAGNFKFKHEPTKWRVGGEKKLIKRLEQIDRSGTLIFCRTKQQVESLRKHWEDHGDIVWSCIGGQTKDFQERLKHSTPEIIVSTSCLSHGVNLPRLQRVVLLDERISPWLGHQMRTRAGRRGENYEVWCTWRSMDKGHTARLWAFLILSIETMMSEIAEHLSDWWYGPRRNCRSNYSSKGT